MEKATSLTQSTNNHIVLFLKRAHIVSWCTVKVLYMYFKFYHREYSKTCNKRMKLVIFPTSRTFLSEPDVFPYLFIYFFSFCSQVWKNGVSVVLVASIVFNCANTTGVLLINAFAFSGHVSKG